MRLAEAEQQAQQQGAFVKVTGMVEFLSQGIFKDVLLTTEAIARYRQTDINVLKAIFPALLWRGLQYACPRQTLRQRARRVCCPACKPSITFS
jgi:hypothetical protein